MSVIFFFIALITLSVVRNYMLSFIAVLLASGSILALIISSDNHNFTHAYVAVITLIMSYFILNEAKLVTQNKTMNRLYEPLRIGLIFSFLGGLFILGKRDLLPLSADLIWLSGIIVVSAIIYTLTKVIDILNIHQKRQKIYIYVSCILVLLPSILAPAVSGALLILLLCFLVNYKTGFAIGIISLIYFIGQYYYDLHFTLLTKSILLFATGMLFLVLYLFFHRKLTSNEKI
ncbi:hypothetical protein D3C85_1186390 [compost metagenome]